MTGTNIWYCHCGQYNETRGRTCAFCRADMCADEPLDYSSREVMRPYRASGLVESMHIYSEEEE